MKRFALKIKKSPVDAPKYIPWRRFVNRLNIDGGGPFYSVRFWRRAAARRECEWLAMHKGIHAAVYDTKTKEDLIE